MSGIRLPVSAEISLMGVSRAFLAPEMNGSDNSESARGALTATVGIFLIFVADAFAQERASVAGKDRCPHAATSKCPSSRPTTRTWKNDQRSDRSRDR